jgi:hypothetical protein
MQDSMIDPQKQIYQEGGDNETNQQCPFPLKLDLYMNKNIVN